MKCVLDVQTWYVLDDHVGHEVPDIRYMRYLLLSVTDVKATTYIPRSCRALLSAFRSSDEPKRGLMVKGSLTQYP